MVLIDRIIANLKRNNMSGYFVESKADLFALLSAFIPKGAIVGCGDSVTLEHTGIFDFLRCGAYCFLDKHKAGLSSNDKREIYLKNFHAHTFVTGSNALTVSGEIFNIDGNGSRVAPMIYGPEQVIIIVGTNKIVDSIDCAVKRARQVAAPLDAKRLKKDTPCAKTGVCIDCMSNQRICNNFVLIARQFIKDRIKVVIINESLGY